jgi:D-serine deaminase-like pyridoxal phosphate-dependent protein
MKKLYIGAILLGGLVVAPFQASMAQSTEVAFANDPRPSNVVVFFDKGTSRLPGVADETIRRAAADADKSAGLVRVVGRADYAAVVKNELVRDGVPARSIVVVPKSGNPLPTIAGDVSDPATRSVEIKY